MPRRSGARRAGNVAYGDLDPRFRRHRSSTTTPAMVPQRDQSPCATRHRYARTASTTAGVRSVLVSTSRPPPPRSSFLRGLLRFLFFAGRSVCLLVAKNSHTRVRPRRATKRVGRYGFDPSRRAVGTSDGRTPRTAATRPRSRVVRLAVAAGAARGAPEEEDSVEDSAEDSGSCASSSSSLTLSGGPRDRPVRQTRALSSERISALGGG